MNWLPVLREVGAHNKTGVTARFLATRLEQPLSTVYRWIELLESCGLLTRHSVSRKIHLGAMAAEIGAAALATPYVDPRVEIELAQMAARLGARVHLVERHHDYAVALRTLHSDVSVMALTTVAKMRLMGMGPGAISLLATLGEPEVRRFYARHVDELTAAGLNEDILLSKVRYVWTHGYCISHGALTQGWTAMGVSLVHEARALAISAALPAEVFAASLGKLKSELLNFSNRLKS